MNQPDMAPGSAARAVEAAAPKPQESGGPPAAKAEISSDPALSAAARLVASSLSSSPISPILLAGFARIVEFTGILVVRRRRLFRLRRLERRPVAGGMLPPLVAGALLAVVMIQLADGYSVVSFRRGGLQLGRVFVAWTTVFVLFAVVAFLGKIGDTYSRVWVTAWYVAGLVRLHRLPPGLRPPGAQLDPHPAAWSAAPSSSAAANRPRS